MKEISKSAAAAVSLVAAVGIFAGCSSQATESAAPTQSEAPTQSAAPKTVTVTAAYAIYDRCKDVSSKLVLSDDQTTVGSVGTKANVCVLDAVGDRSALVKHMQKKTTVVGKVYQTPWNGYTVYWSYEDSEITIIVDSNGQTVTSTVESGLDA